MKKIILSTLILGTILSSILMFSSCLKDKCSEKMTYKVWVPILKPISEIRAEIKIAAPQPVLKTGQIYLYQNWLLIGAPQRGIHVFDNTNPDAPQNVAFINLPGAVDMAVRDGILFADNYIDLVAVDISNPLEPNLTKRLENVFPYSLSQNSLDNYIIGYRETDTTVSVACSDGRYGRNYFECGDFSFDKGFGVQSGIVFSDGPASNAPSTGVGGSYARFTIAGERLYTVDFYSLHAFDIETPSNPKAVGAPIQVDWTVETLFSLDQKLFVGSNNGTFIYDAESNPDNPQKLSEFIHARACDPVVADAKTAYITLHDGSECLGFANQLDVVDISNIKAPKLIKTFPMKRPFGLGVRGNELFLCDEGFKVFDNSDPKLVGERLLSHDKTLNVTDVIPVPWSKDLILRGEKGIYQMDASDPKNLRLRSLIAVIK
jgi:hypothetical protein